MKPGVCDPGKAPQHRHGVFGGNEDLLWCVPDEENCSGAKPSNHQRHAEGFDGFDLLLLGELLPRDRTTSSCSGWTRCLTMSGLPLLMRMHGQACQRLKQQSYRLEVWDVGSTGAWHLRESLGSESGGVCSCIGYTAASRRDAPLLFRQAASSLTKHNARCRTCKST